MNDMTKSMSEEAKIAYRMMNGMLPEEASYMRGNMAPPTSSMPRSTSKYLNSPLFREAFSTMSLRRMGEDVPVTYDIPDMSRGLADVADHAETARLLAVERERNPALAQWLDARKPIDLEIGRLQTCEAGTFGADIYDFIVRSGMDMQFVWKEGTRSDLEYLIKMMGQTHDLQHMMTGFGPNMAGEHALATMNLAAGYRLLSPELAHAIYGAMSFVTSAMFPRVLFNYPHGVPIIFEATQQGLAAGNTVRMPLFMVDFTSYLDWRSEDIAADLGFKRGPGSDWEFSEGLCSG